MKRISIVVVFLPLYLIFCSASISTVTSAVANESNQTVLQVSPVLEDIIVNPGVSIHKQLQITNLSSISVPIKAYTRSFIATDETGGSDYPDIADASAAQHWFKIDNSEFIVGPNSSVTFPLTIDVPKNAEPGGHYATLFFESLAPINSTEANSLYVSSRIGSLFFLSVSGEIKQSGYISEFSTKYIWRSGLADFKLAFENNGNVHLKPESELTIHKNGKIVRTLKDNGQTILPQKTRRWQLQLDTPLSPGIYKAVLSTKNTATGKLTSKEVNFIVLPVYEAIIGLTGFIVGLVILKGRHRFVRAIKSLSSN